MIIMWTYSITKEPEFDPKYPTDPVDWEAELTDGKEIIYVTFTGTCNNDDTLVTPWPEDEVKARLGAMAQGLDRG